MRLEKQDGGWGYSAPALRPKPLQPAQPPTIQLIKKALVAVAILAAIIGVPMVAAETMALGISVGTVKDAVLSLIEVAAVFMMLGLVLLQMGWDS